MPRPILFATIIEALLLLACLVCLLQPSWVLGRSFERGGQKGSVWKSILNGLGFIFLSLSFCWSVVLGILIVLNGLTLRI